MKAKLLYSAVILSGLFSSSVVFALPTGGQVVGGSATISQSPQTTTIHQTSQNAVINWQGFDTAIHESVIFNQPTSTSTVLNRITSGLPTNFAGNLTANGRVFIVNPAGMVFAGTSKINAASFVATTLDANKDDFMNGVYKFKLKPGTENAKIINNGIIATMGDAGVISLIAPNVSNGKTGMIQAQLGKILLGSTPGYTMVVDFNSDELINFDVTKIIRKQARLLENAGTIQNTGGIVGMVMVPTDQVLDNVINMSGVIEANNLSVDKQGLVLIAGLHTNTTISGAIKADNGNVIVMSSSINQTDTGHISTRYLSTESLPGKTKLNDHNSVSKYEHREVTDFDGMGRDDTTGDK